MKEYHTQRAEELGLPEGTGKRYSVDQIESFIAASPKHKTAWQEFEELNSQLDSMGDYVDSFQSTMPRIVAPGFAFSITYIPPEGLTKAEEADLHEKLFTSSRFMVENMRVFHQELLKPE